MKHRPIRVGMLGVTAAAVLGAAQAAAAPLLYEIGGETYFGPASASFVIDSNPIPTVVYDGLGFQIDGVEGSFDFVDTGRFTLADILFLNENTDFGPELDITPAGTFDYPLAAGFGAALLYSGDESAPTLLVGEYQLFDLRDRTKVATVRVSAIPEPATWAAMIAGFSLIGAMTRRRTATVQI